MQKYHTALCKARVNTRMADPLTVTKFDIHYFFQKHTAFLDSHATLNCKVTSSKLRLG